MKNFQTRRKTLDFPLLPTIEELYSAAMTEFPEVLKFKTEDALINEKEFKRLENFLKKT